MNFKPINLKIIRSFCHGFECQSALSSVFLNPSCLAHFTERQMHASLVTGFSNYKILKSNGELKLRGLPEDTFHGCLNNSASAIHFYLNLEAYISCNCWLFPWHRRMQSPQCSAMFQIYSAVNEGIGSVVLHNSEETKSKGRNVDIVEFPTFLVR